MPLISTPEKLVGGYVPVEEAEAFTVITHAYGSNNNNEIRKFISNYIKSHSITDAIKMMAKEFFEYGESVFKANQGNKDFLDAYCVEIRKTLKKKFILTGYIDQVCAEVSILWKEKYGKAKEKKGRFGRTKGK